MKYPHSPDPESLLASADDESGRGEDEEEELSARSLCRDSSLPQCGGSSSCEKICDDIFSAKKKANCYRSPEPLVEKFKDTLKIIKNEDFEELDSGVLECLLKIDNKQFARTVGNLSKSEAKEFLLKAAADKTFARVLESGDKKNFRILQEALEAISADVKKGMREKIYGSFNLLTLAARHNNPHIYNWLNDLIWEDCSDKKPSCNVMKDYYCDALTGLTDSQLRKFLRARFFKDDYSRMVEKGTCGSGRCDYGDPGDFKTFCDGL